MNKKCSNMNECSRNKGGAGKGDKPRSIGKKYWDNFDQINWGKKDEQKKPK